MSSHLLLSTEMTKESLLEGLRASLKQHQEEYVAAREGFRLEAIEQLEDLQTEIEDNPDTFEIPRELQRLEPPESHVKDYERAIKMLESNVNETIKLTGEQYAAYVNGEWEWRRGWELSNRKFVIKSTANI